MNYLPVALLALLFVPAAAYGLGYVVDAFEYELEDGQSTDATIRITGVPGSTVLVGSLGEGSDMLVLPETATFPQGSDFTELDFNIAVPVDYPAGVYTPLVSVTQEGDKTGQVVINSQVHIKLTISVDSDTVAQPDPKLEPESDPEPTSDPVPEPVSDPEPDGAIRGGVIPPPEDAIRGGVVPVPDDVIQDGGGVIPPPEQQCDEGYELVGGECVEMCGPGTVYDDGFCRVVAESAAPEGGGCLVATAAYGTELAPQVQMLREVRDGTVLSTAYGASFMSSFNTAYYSFSPALADMQRENPALRDTVRALITPMVATLSIMTLADPGSEGEVLGLGLLVIALNLAMYGVAPAVLVHKVTRFCKR